MRLASREIMTVEVKYQRKSEWWCVVVRKQPHLGNQQIGEIRLFWTLEPRQIDPDLALRIEHICSSGLFKWVYFSVLSRFFFVRPFFGGPLLGNKEAGP
jgi:hypothetical protein